MTRAEKFINIVFKAEGLYSNDKRDSGGETVFGIARNYHPTWEGWKIVDLMKRQPNFPQSLKNNKVLISLKNNFYTKQFYYPVKADYINNELLALHVFDFGVNAGISRSIKTLQKVVGVVEDGIIGKNTLAATNATDCTQAFINARISYYKKIGVGKNAVFLKGWLNRVNNIKI